MTYRAIAKAIKAHRGRVYAAVNLAGYQLQLEVKKGEAYDTFHNYAVTHGDAAESGATILIQGDDLLIDSKGE